jgi:septal ring factor EnvC (AmiA/AmiB activator)
MVAEHKLAAMTAERDSFRQSLADMYDERTARLEEAQAREQQLRKAIRELITTFGKVRDE